MKLITMSMIMLTSSIVSGTMFAMHRDTDSMNQSNPMLLRYKPIQTCPKIMNSPKRNSPDSQQFPKTIAPCSKNKNKSADSIVRSLYLKSLKKALKATKKFVSLLNWIR